eukprot:jgi/Chrpa1/5161/Chrysochromulina_OHIO_Genome00011239-RA
MWKARSGSIDPCASMGGVPYVPRDLAAEMAAASDEEEDEEALRIITGKLAREAAALKKKGGKKKTEPKAKVARKPKGAPGAASGSASAAPPVQAAPPSARVSSPPPSARGLDPARSWSRDGVGGLRSADRPSRKRQSMEDRAVAVAVAAEQRRATKEARSKAPDSAIQEEEEVYLDAREEGEEDEEDEEGEEGEEEANEPMEEEEVLGREEDVKDGQEADEAAKIYEEALASSSGVHADDPPPREQDGRPLPRAGVRRANYDVKTVAGKAFVMDALGLISSESYTIFMPTGQFLKDKNVAKGNQEGWRRVAAQLSRNCGGEIDLTNLKQRIWLGGKARGVKGTSFRSLMQEYKPHYDSTHPKGASGTTESPTDVQKKISELLELLVSARSAELAQEEERAGQEAKRAAAEAEQAEAFKGAAGRRAAGSAKNAKAPAPPGATPAPPPSARPSGGSQRSSGHASGGPEPSSGKQKARTWGSMGSTTKFTKSTALTALGMNVKTQKAWIGAVNEANAKPQRHAPFAPAEMNGIGKMLEVARPALE